MLVIKGAYYYDKSADTVLIPHYTGEFYMVDCDRYMIVSELTDVYDEKWIEDNKENNVEYKGTTYYYAEYSPWNITEKDWELLSDLSELNHVECDYGW